MKRIYIITALAWALAGCQNLLDIYPKESISAGQIQESDLESLLIGAYDGVQGMYAETYLVDDNAADNLKWRASDSKNGEIDDNEVTSGNTFMLEWWNLYFTNIARCNDLLAQLDRMEETVKIKELRSETKVLRAWNYYRLTIEWGAVPIVGKITFDQTSRDAEEEVWAFIKKDLEYAAENGPAFSSATRTSKLAGKALLARVCLVAPGAARDLARAAELAEEVIGSPDVSLSENYAEIWQQKSNEMILQWTNRSDDKNYLGYFLLSNVTSPYNALSKGRLEYSVDQALVDAYEPGDLRKPGSVRKLTDGQGNALNPAGHEWDCIKYPSAGTSDDPWPVVRIAEMYLVSAEAQGYPNGIGRLNDLRATRGLGELTGVTAENFIEKVMQERRVELAFEGFRWYDLRRWYHSGEAGKKAVLHLNKLKGTESIGSRPASQTMNIADDGYNLLFPLPESAMSTNPALKPNNPGYAK